MGREPGSRTYRVIASLCGRDAQTAFWDPAGKRLFNRLVSHHKIPHLVSNKKQQFVTICVFITQKPASPFGVLGDVFPIYFHNRHMPTHFSCQIAVFRYNYFMSLLEPSASLRPHRRGEVEVPNFLPICHMNPRSRIVLSDPDVLLIGRAVPDMLWIMLGCAAFVLFFFYDIAGATGRFYPFRIGFAAGCLLLLSSTAGLVWQGLWGRHIVWPVFSFSPFWPFFF